MKEFLAKKFGGLPVWAWALIGAAGIGAGYLLIRWQGKKTPASLTPANSADLTTGNASGNETNSATGTVGANGVIDNPFPESNVNGQQIPIVPPGYQAVYDPNGNIVGWEPIPTNPTPTPPTTVNFPPPALTPRPAVHPAILPASAAPLTAETDGATAQPGALNPMYARRVG